MTTDTEAAELQLVAEARARMRQFQAVLNLGKAATALEKQAEEIRKSIDLLNLEDYPVPEGAVILLETKRSEDPFEAEVLHELLTGGATWDKSGPGGIAYRANITEDSNHRQFWGHDVGYDSINDEVWVYNAAGNFRVRLLDDIDWHALSDSSGGD